MGRGRKYRLQDRDIVVPAVQFKEPSVCDLPAPSQFLVHEFVQRQFRRTRMHACQAGRLSQTDSPGLARKYPQYFRSRL
jgi:hypothetical protein